MNWRLNLVALGVFALGVGLYVVDRFYVGVFHDDAMYLVLARSLASGQGYRWINLPDAPIASHFPPGYPLLLAAFWKLSPNFPANVGLFKAFNAVCFAVSTLLIAQIAREKFDSERWGTGVGLVSAVSVPLLVLVTMVLSEPFFLVLALTVLLLGERLIADDDQHPGRALMIGALIGMAMLVRSHGVVLALAFLLLLAKRGRWRDAGAALAGVLLFVLPWKLWMASQTTALAPALAGNYGSYAGWWLRGVQELGSSMVPRTIGKTVLETVGMLLALLSPSGLAVVRIITLVAMLAALGVGASTLKRRMPLIGLFLVGYSAIVFVWPFPPARFFWGIWPLLVLLFAAAIWTVMESTTMRRNVRMALAIACAWLVLGYALYEVRAVRGKWWSSISRASNPRIAGAVAWIDRNTSPSDVVAADDEGAVFLYTGRKSVPVASFTAASYLEERSAEREASEGLVPLIARYPVRVVVVGSRKSFEAAQFLATKPDALLAPREGFANGAAFITLRK